MSINIRSEQLLSLSQAARQLPGRPAPSTMWRWHRRGIRGIRLETIVIGGVRYTSREALDRFIVAQTAAREPVSDGDIPEDRSENTIHHLKQAGLM